jgi:hypothetical protein
LQVVYVGYLQAKIGLDMLKWECIKFWLSYCNFKQMWRRGSVPDAIALGKRQK